ncbi:MAG: peptidase U32 family protein, partial [Acetatifactor sp.]
MKARKKVELLAPAGNMEGFYGAIHAGADAVYLGGNRFGARAYADNFTLEELTFCIRYAHIWGRKVYLTVNTLVKEQEFKELYEYLAPLYEAGLDAVIVQDIGVFHYIKSQFPGLLLHVSTQMTITGVYGAELLKTMGASRIVPARELSLEEIAKIKQETNLEIECFIHGAMCYCYSGQCLFSSILGGRSGNRGRCAQPCRLPYS